MRTDDVPCVDWWCAACRSDGVLCVCMLVSASVEAVITSGTDRRREVSAILKDASGFVGGEADVRKSVRHGSCSHTVETPGDQGKCRIGRREC